MTEITIIRHGQANSGARSEADYDRLSGLGRQQALWLGQHFTDIGGFDRIVSGTLRRQEETAQALNVAARPQAQDPRLNELDYFRLSELLEARDGVPFPTDPQSFAAHVPQILELWRNGHADAEHESYADFRARVLGVVADMAGDGPGAVLVSSTGVIATLCAFALGLETVVKARMFLRILNTSVHRFDWTEGELHLVQFGATPHLDRPERHFARTHF